MNIQQAKEEIEAAILAYLQKDAYGKPLIPVQAQRPILLMGPPGIGKTAIMEQIAQDLQIGLVAYSMTHHTRQSAIGLPFIEEQTYEGQTYHATIYTMSEIIAAIYEKIRKTGVKEGILFLDEINCVSETLAPAILSLLQKKCFGSHQVPQGYVIVAAGNPPEYNKSVRAFDIVTLDRVRRIDVTQDFQVWKSYAYERMVHQSIITYLELKPEHFYQIETTASGKRFVTARGWEDLSYMIRTLEQMGQPVTMQLVLQYLQHPQIARDYANYYDLYNQYRDDYHVEEILNGQVRESTRARLLEARFDERVSLIGLLIGALNTGFADWCGQNDQTGRLYELLLQARELSEGAAGQAGEPLEEAAGQTGAGQAGELSEDGVGAARELLAQEASPDAHAAVTESPKLREDQHTGSIREQLLQLFEAAFVQADTQDAFTKIVERYQSCIQAGGNFSDLKAMFEQETKRLETMADVLGARLEHAFTFLEQVFGTGQELVIFVTELNTSRSAAEFITENGSDAYYKYNRELLFTDQHASMRKEIETVRPFLDV